MKTALERIERAQDLPGDWDLIAKDFFQKRIFLCHCQEYNPCRQRYYLLSSNGALLAGAIVYTLRLDLLTYLGIKSPMTMQVVGVPCSVASSGLTGDPGSQAELLCHVLRQEQGLFAILNVDDALENVPAALGRTWPDILFLNRFADWASYSAALRSDYRRRLAQVQEDALEFTIQTAPCSAFTPGMHAMYLEVLHRSEGKLETLEYAFFRNLPSSFRLTTYAAQGVVRGWTITQRDGEQFFFFLGGQDYKLASNQLYLVQLMTILKQGIASGARLIHFGQSAEIPKMRLGGIPREKIMLASHSRPLPRAMLGATIGLLSYRKHFPRTHVFREDSL